MTPRPILTAVFRTHGAPRMLLRFPAVYPEPGDRWITVRVQDVGAGGIWEAAARDVAALSGEACELLWECAEDARTYRARCQTGALSLGRARRG